VFGWIGWLDLSASLTNSFNLSVLWLPQLQNGEIMTGLL
jgi:hypothetical protein